MQIRAADVCADVGEARHRERAFRGHATESRRRCTAEAVTVDAGMEKGVTVKRTGRDGDAVSEREETARERWRVEQEQRDREKHRGRDGESCCAAVSAENGK